MKILTLGKGFVSDHLPYEKILDKIYVDYKDLDHLLSKQSPDVIVNCIGRTGRPNVDWCENNREDTLMSNVILPAMIADWCGVHGVHLIQLSSGCIYFGDSPHKEWTNVDDGNFSLGGFEVDTGWQETDFANPKSYYSKTKYACDLLLAEMPHVTTLRLRMPVSTKNDPRNFINKIRGYDKVINIPNSMTMMDDLVRCIDWAAKESKMGIYHVANPDPMTAAQVMREYQKYRPEHKFEIINEKQLDAMTVAKRSNCILNTEKLNSAGFFMTPSKEALETCMAAYIKNI